MTEQDWLTAPDPQGMLTLLSRRNVPAPRKHRLFACACCRRIWDRFPDPRNRALVAAVEDFPTHTFNDPEIYNSAVASSACEGECRDHPAYWAAKYLGRGFYKMSAAVSAAVVSARVLSMAATDGGSALFAETEAQTRLLWCVFGNPFRPPAFADGWRTDTVTLLAARMYESRDFGPAPILADALQDAGCDDEHLLAHLRDPQATHVRGCWAVDLALGLSEVSGFRSAG